MPALSIGFVLLPDFTMTPFAGLLDVLRLAADDGDGSRPRRVRWRITGEGSVTSSAGVRIAPDEALGNLARFDYVVVCGGLLRDESPHDPGLLTSLTRARSVVGLCTASFVLAEAGLLAGRRACVSWFHHAAFRAAYPDVAVSGTEIFVIDGPVITCAGGSGGIDVGAWMVDTHLGAATARKALDILLHGEKRAPESPQPHRASHVLRDPRLRTAALLIEQRLGNPPPIAALAAAVGLSRRQLERLFVSETGLSPGAFVLEARLGQARWLMETTSQTLTHIAAETGFGDAAHFSRAFRRRFGTAPSRAGARGSR